MPVWPVWKTAGTPSSSIASYSGYTAGSLGVNPCRLGWNLNPRTPCPATSRRARRTASPGTSGSTEPNGISTSACPAARSAISSLDSAG